MAKGIVWTQYRNAVEQPMYEAIFAWGRYLISHDEKNPVPDQDARPIMTAGLGWVGPWKLEVFFNKPQGNNGRMQFVLHWAGSVQEAKTVSLQHLTVGVAPLGSAGHGGG